MATFYNQATLSYNDNITNSNIVSGEFLEVLSATKNSLSDIYRPNDSITYIISIVNSGPTALTNLTLVDNLGAYTFGNSTLIPLDYVEGSLLFYSNGVLTTPPTAVVDSSLIITGISVPANGNVILIYEADVNQFAPPIAGSTITNEAVISGNGIITDITITNTITVATDPMLTISKSVSPNSVVENGTLTYTLVIQNSGNTPATANDNIVVTDTFDPVLNNITVTLNDTILTEPADYTYNETTGVFSTVSGRITVPAATYTQDPTTGAWITTPGVSVLEITGTV